MPDTRRLPIAPADDAASRDTQIDALLEDGLDRYFNGKYEDAIHLWTRVLFLDRTHARARAYIDRARTALAEQQRRSEELLQASRELLDRGQTDAARQLLTEAMAASADDVQGAALGARLERAERARAATSAPVAVSHSPVETVPGWTWRRTPPLALAAAAVVVLATTLVAAVWLWGPDPDAGVPVVRPAAVDSRLPVLSSSGVALVRARTLYAQGRLSEALKKLDGVALDSPERAAAETLRIEIQQLLLASVRSSTSSALLEANRR